MEEESFPIRHYSPKELAAEYRCSMKTLKRWLMHLQQELGPRQGRSYTPKQVRLIVDRLGKPY